MQDFPAVGKWGELWASVHQHTVNVNLAVLLTSPTTSVTVVHVKYILIAGVLLLSTWYNPRF